MKYNKKILMKVEKQPILYHVRENDYPSSCVLKRARAEHQSRYMEVSASIEKTFKEEFFYGNSAQHIRN